MEIYSRLFVALMIGIVFGIITSAAPRRKASLHPAYLNQKHRTSLAKNRPGTNKTKKPKLLSHKQAKGITS